MDGKGGISEVVSVSGGNEKSSSLEESSDLFLVGEEDEGCEEENENSSCDGCSKGDSLGVG